MIHLLEPTGTTREDLRHFLEFSQQFVSMLTTKHIGIFYEEADDYLTRMGMLFHQRIHNILPSTCTQPDAYYDLHGLARDEWKVKVGILRSAAKRFFALEKIEGESISGEYSLQFRHAANWVLNGINTILGSLLDSMTGGAAIEAKDMIHGSLKLY